MTSHCANIILISSPDTDIYNIGLNLLNTNKEYIIQLNVHHATKKKYLILNNFKLALHRDQWRSQIFLIGEADFGVVLLW